MNAASDDEAKADYCASCGKAEIDDVKLKPCSHCDLFHYCSDECQREHRLTHEQDCKMKAAELRDELLFRQPESSHLGDCPICMLPLPIEKHESMLFQCCNNRICNGCDFATNINSVLEKSIFGVLECLVLNEMRPGSLKDKDSKCPFCRVPVLPLSDDEHEKKLKIVERVAVNDPVAISSLAEMHYNDGDCEEAVKNWLRAAELGDAEAHFNLSTCYREGHGVEEDKKLMLHHLAEAAIRGHLDARHDLALSEWDDESYDRAVLHWIIAANLGHKESIKALTTSYKDGHVSKEAFAAALRAHQAAMDEMKSPQRDEAKRFSELSGSSQLCNLPSVSKDK